MWTMWPPCRFPRGPEQRLRVVLYAPLHLSRDRVMSLPDPAIRAGRWFSARPNTELLAAQELAIVLVIGACTLAEIQSRRRARVHAGGSAEMLRTKTELQTLTAKS